MQIITREQQTILGHAWKCKKKVIGTCHSAIVSMG